MNDPLGFYLLLGIGAFAIVLSAIGVRTGTAMTIYRHSRAVHPTMFWFSTLFQFVLGLACLVLAVVKVFES